MDLKTTLRVILRAVIFMLRNGKYRNCTKKDLERQSLNLEVMLQGLEDDSVIVK